MLDARTFVIAGGGLAGAKAAETLREEGFEGRVVLVGAEPDRPYERPPLSKGVLLDKDPRDSVFLHPAAWFPEHDVDLRTGVAVTTVDRQRRRVRFSHGDEVAYDKLLLATGADPRPLRAPGANLDGVLRLRTLPDSDRLAAAVSDGTRLVVVGAGWIGLEVAAAAREHDADVTVVTPSALPLRAVLGDEMATVFADLHRTHGVTFRYATQIVEIRGSSRVSQVVLSDGSVLDADVVLVAIGVRPNVALADQAGLAVDDGVLVDHRLATSDPDIFAAGDIANHDHPLLHTRIRVEHWATALHSGPAAARAMLGQEVTYDRLPYFYTDQYDLGMEYTGWVPPDAHAEVVVRGDLDGRRFIAFWTVDGRVAAGMNLNVWDVTDPIEALIRAGLNGKTVDPGRLADPDVPLTEL
jgi:3-phenylpropionate/trans-cinnamate dioxygenase ferredoxin reductase component